VKYAFVDTHLRAYPLWLACTTLGVCASGYHAWKDRAPAPRTLEQQRLVFLIKTIYHRSGGVYGAPRIYAVLQAEHGYTGSLNRVKALMRAHGIRAKTRRKFKATTDSNHELPIAPNLLSEPEDQPSGPNQAFVSDITYIRTQEGWLYLAAVMDLYTRAIVGWALKPRMSADLVLDALTMAWFRKRPSPGTIFHSDRGSQYASKVVRKHLARNRMRQSMSGKGNCFDNAAMESFWKTLKTERVYLQKIYQTREIAKADIVAYIETFYNPERLHSALGYRSPNQFEQEQYKKLLKQKRSTKSSTKS
jgi:putative transposase